MVFGETLSMKRVWAHPDRCPDREMVRRTRMRSQHACEIGEGDGAGHGGSAGAQGRSARRRDAPRTELVRLCHGQGHFRNGADGLRVRGEEEVVPTLRPLRAVAAADLDPSLPPLLCRCCASRLFGFVAICLGFPLRHFQCMSAALSPCTAHVAPRPLPRAVACRRNQNYCRRLGRRVVCFHLLLLFCALPLAATCPRWGVIGAWRRESESQTHGACFLPLL